MRIVDRDHVNTNTTTSTIKGSLTSSNSNSKTIDIDNKLSDKEGKEIKRMSKANKFNNIIAIGSSTGGPKALQEILSQLPDNIDAYIVTIQTYAAKVY